MAAARKKYSPPNRADKSKDKKVHYFSFMKDLLGGTIQATKLHDGVDGQGNPDFDYDDPD